MGIILRYSDIFDERIPHPILRKIVREFRRDNLFLQLSVINSLLSNSRILGGHDVKFSSDEEEFGQIQEFLVSNFIDDYTLINIKKQYGSEKTSELIIFTRQTVAYLMRLCLLNSPQDRGIYPDGKTDAGFKLGLSFLIANDFLTSRREEKTLDSKKQVTVLKNLGLQISPSLEFENPLTLKHGIYRFQQLFFNTANSNEFKEFIKKTRNREPFALDEKFKAATGITLRQYRDFLIGVLVSATRGSLEKPEDIEPIINRQNFISNSIVSQGDFDSYLNLEATNLDYLRAKLLSKSNMLNSLKYNELKKKPFLETSPGTFCVADPAFVSEKLGLGGYWTINDCLEKPDRESFKNYFGDVFEFYVNRLLESSLSNMTRSNAIFIASPEYKNGGTSFDAILFFPATKHLIVLEHKASLLREEAKYSGSVKKFESELKTKFLKDEKGKPRGVGQLAKHIGNIFHTERAKRRKMKDKAVSIIMSEAEKVSPVLVGLEPFLMTHIIEGEFLSKYFRDELKNHSITNRITVKPLTVIHIEALERFIPYLRADDVTIEQLLNSRFHRDPHYRLFFSPASFFNPPISLLNQSRQNEEIEDYFYSVWNTMKTTWFGNDNGVEPEEYSVV